MRLPHTIETVTGVGFDYTRPEVNLEDVAHGLSNVCRFGGHTQSFYSVAEHSVLVSSIVERLMPEMALAALWHDAHEAYMGDLATPLKRLVGPDYEGIAARIDQAACEYIGLDPESCPMRHPIIKYADELAMLYEASRLKSGPGWEFTRVLDHSLAEGVSNLTLALLPGEAAGLFKASHRYLLKDRA